MLLCSPRTWGWTAIGQRDVARLPVFPTHVGMDRTCFHCRGIAKRVPHARGDGPKNQRSKERFFCVPHARGDGPNRQRRYLVKLECSPRTWGWTDVVRHLDRRPTVFPTHVGMDRIWGSVSRSVWSVPPRTWGWTGENLWCQDNRQVFPTHVGMDRWLLLSGR